jgi:hypothetical protein
MNHFIPIIIGLGLLFLTGCTTSTTESKPSSVAQLKAFSFARNDSMPGLAQAIFTIEERLDTGLVWNKDSMLYGTQLDSVVPRFVYAATPGSAYLTLSDSTYELKGGYDTFDFTKTPIFLTIRSADGSNTKVYEIQPTVHQVDPDLYTWTQLTARIYPEDESEQCVLLLNNEFVMLTSNGFELKAWTSTEGEQWTDLGPLSGLHSGARIRQVISDGTQLYYGEGNNIYTSNDATHWTAMHSAYTIHTMLLYWNKNVWALVENNGYELAIWDGTQMQLTGLRPNSDFPISNFATVNFHSASQRERALIIGGYAQNGKALNTRWNLEYSPYSTTGNAYRMEEFSIDRPTFTSLTGVSVIWYNNQLLMFGGVNQDMNYMGRNILISQDEGLNWTPADTTKNQLPAAYGERQKQNAIVRNNYIYLFGGQDKNTTYSDVYRGKLNSIDW